VTHRRGRPRSLLSRQRRIDITGDGVIHTVSFRRPVNAKPPGCDVGKKRSEHGLPAFVF
jgi:hypothetical protein